MVKFCEFCQVGDYGGSCTCIRSNQICPLVRRCTIHEKWLPLDSMETCSIRTKKQMEKNIKLNNGEYAVLHVQNGKLYIDYKGDAIRMINPYDYEPDKVELVEVDGVVYIKEFAPTQLKDEPQEVEVKSDEEDVVAEKKTQPTKKKKGERK